MTPLPSWFEALGRPRDDRDIAWMMSDKGSHGSPLITRKPIIVAKGYDSIPDVASFDPRFIEWYGYYLDKLNAELQPDLADDLFVGANGLHADFEKGRCIAGYSMDQMSLAPRDNAAFVEELGLPNSFRSLRHAQIFDRFARKVFSSYSMKSIKTPGLSTAGAPVWEMAATFKREHAMVLLDQRHEVLKLFEDGQLFDLAGSYKVVFLKNCGRRDQVDSLGKVRWVFPLDYALSGGRSGSPVQAGKQVVMNGNVLAKWSATRARLFHGTPYAVNLYGQIIATGTLHALFEQFPKTFHTTDVVAMAEGIPPTFDLVCSDATEYDRSMAQFLIARLFAIARDYWHPTVIDWVEHSTTCAYFSRPVSLDPDTPEGRPQMVCADGCTPYDKVVHVQSGNPSGVAWTSLIAKFMMTFDFLATVDDLTHDVLERMDAYLNHQTQLYTFNNGDDGCYVGERQLLAAYRAYRFPMANGKPDLARNPGYFVLEPEAGHVWSGYILARKPEGGFTAFHRAQTMVEKMFVPERSAGSAFRPYWTIGIMDRLLFGDFPTHGRVRELLFSTWSEKLSGVYGEFMEIVTRHHNRIPSMVTNGLTAIDRAVIEDPTKLYHRYTIDDVSPHVLKMLMEHSLRPSEFEVFVRDFYRGVIISGDSHE